MNMPTSILEAPTLDYLGQRRPPGRDRYDEACAQAARDAIRRWMQDNDLTQERAGELLGGLDQTAFTKMFRPPEKKPTQPSLRTLIIFSRVAKMSLDEVLGLSRERNEEEERLRRIEEAARRGAERALEGGHRRTDSDPPSMTGRFRAKKKRG